MKITKLAVIKLPVPPISSSGRTVQKRYYDDKLKGFGVRVTSGGTKAFFVEKLIERKVRRITIGRYPEITVEQARNQAQQLLGQIAMGINPIAEKKARRVRLITLHDIFEDYKKARKSLKPTTVLDYERVLKQVVPDWLNKPALNITKDMVIKRHAQYGSRNSEARANLAMRLLRALFNFAEAEYEDARGRPIFAENPTSRLTYTRAWYRVERRQSVIKHHQLPKWYQAVMRLSICPECRNGLMMQDYFLLVLFTGLRRHEAASLQWADVDLTARTFTLHDTKNRESHTLPLSDFLYELFVRRAKARINGYVFPANSASGHLEDPRKALLKVNKLSGIKHTIHDLRRTFATIAESLDISAYSLKRLLNHKSTSDVTAGYIITDVERLRKPMQLITDYLLSVVGGREATNVIALTA